VSEIRSLHLVGSKTMGGAERWFVRFLHAMRAHGEPAEAVVRTGSELARSHLAGIPFRESPMRTVWDPWSRHQLTRLVRASGVPIVQTYMGRATRLLRLPRPGAQVHVARLGGYYKIDPFRNAHAWVGNTRGLCDWLVQQGLPADRVFHIYNFAEPARPPEPGEVEALRCEIGVRAEDVLLLTAGRFVDVKGHRFLLDAVARLPTAVGGRRLRLLMLGDGPLLADLKTQTRQAGIDDRVIWLGWRDDLAPWYALADLVVFPSRDAETLGNVILEAWAYGKPLVTAAFRGAREIARHGEDAWVVPCDDAAALAAGIGEVLRDPAIARAIAAPGRPRVAAEFAEATIIAHYRDLYRRLVETG
jgi:glycosyltransferase involved in cell wall biosynthesis